MKKVISILFALLCLSASAQEIMGGLGIVGATGPTGATGSSSYVFDNGLTESGDTVKLGGTLTENSVVDADSNILEFTTAYGHNLIFTNNFLSLGYNFTGEYHNDSGVVYLNGIVDVGGVKYSSIAVIDGVNGSTAYAQVSPSESSIGFMPNSQEPYNSNQVIAKNDYVEIVSKDNDADELSVSYIHSNNDNTFTQVARVYRDGAMSTDSGFYIGDKTTDGSWRFVTSGANLVIQKRESGNWVTKQTITP